MAVSQSRAIFSGSHLIDFRGPPVTGNTEKLLAINHVGHKHFIRVLEIAREIARTDCKIGDNLYYYSQKEYKLLNLGQGIIN